MPKLYRFDDYEQCMGIYENEALYCVVNSYIKPDSNSEIYKIVEEFSSNRKQHLRHNKLQRGLCVNSCKKIVENSQNQGRKYFVGKIPMDSKASESSSSDHKIIHEITFRWFLISSITQMLKIIELYITTSSTNA